MCAGFIVAFPSDEQPRRRSEKLNPVKTFSGDKVFFHFGHLAHTRSSRPPLLPARAEWPYLWLLSHWRNYAGEAERSVNALTISKESGCVHGKAKSVVRPQAKVGGGGGGGAGVAASERMEIIIT